MDKKEKKSLPEPRTYTVEQIAAMLNIGRTTAYQLVKQTERITMASRPKQPKYARNKNILVIGGSGSGKTRFFCKPSLLQAHSSYGLSYQKLGKELMTQDELAVMDGGKCIFMLRGVRPFLSDKYDLTQHPNYRYTADADPKNVFDMERYMKKQRAVVKPTDTFDVYEIDATT